MSSFSHSMQVNRDLFAIDENNDCLEVVQISCGKCSCNVRKQVHSLMRRVTRNGHSIGSMCLAQDMVSVLFNFSKYARGIEQIQF